MGTGRKGWSAHVTTLRNTAHGGHIETNHQAVFTLSDGIGTHFSLPTISAEQPGSMNEVINSDLCQLDGMRYGDLQSLTPAANDPLRRATESKFSASVDRVVKRRFDGGSKPSHPAYNPAGPAPSISLRGAHEEFFGGVFGIWTGVEGERDDAGVVCRPVRRHELPALLGLRPTRAKELLLAPWEQARERLRCVPGMHGLAAALAAIRQAEATERAHAYDTAGAVDPTAPEVVTTAFAGAVNPLTTIALLTDEALREASAGDNDINLIISALADGSTVAKKDLSEKRYFTEWKKGNFDTENGILFFHEEGRRATVRQLRLRVVPKELRMAIFSACHSSPMAGHSSVKRTLFRIEARFWWPGRWKDVTELVTSCAHCRMGNAARHESTGLLQGMCEAAPLEVVFLDFWSPGKSVTDPSAASTVLTYVCCMTGFAAVGFAGGEITAEKVAALALESFFGPFGLPKMIVVDADSVFKGFFETLFESLGVPVYAVSRTNHRAVRNEMYFL
jgi:hypothetical protein